MWVLYIYKRDSQKQFLHKMFKVLKDQSPRISELESFTFLIQCIYKQDLIKNMENNVFKDGIGV